MKNNTRFFKLVVRKLECVGFSLDTSNDQFSFFEGKTAVANMGLFLQRVILSEYVIDMLDVDIELIGPTLHEVKALPQKAGLNY